MDITAIFRQHYPELVRLAVMLVGDRPTAEDVVQDVFATLHARRDRPGPRGDQLAYVRACVLNGCRSALRRRAGLSRIGGSAALVPDLPHESAEHEVIRAEGRRQVLAALAALPRRCREVLVLRYYLGLREAEIAAVLGITPGTATGAVTATIASPFSGHGPFEGFAAAVATGEGGQEFVAEYDAFTPRGNAQTRLYMFRLTSTGRVAGLSLINGGPLAGYVPDGALAVSPDGSKVALSVYRPAGTFSAPPAPKIVVIDLRTGARSFWAGGLHRAGFAQTILSISWGPGSDALTFLSQWCHNSVVLRYCGFGQHFAQVRTLRLVPGGGLLSAGSLLLSESAQRSYMVQALLSPDGKALTIAVLGPPYLETGQQTPQVLQVSRVPLAGGRPRLLYRGAVDGHVFVFLGSDSSGRHLLLAGAGNGWIDHGRLRPLPPQGGVVSTDAW